MNGFIMAQETYSGSINPNDSVEYIFVQTYNSPAGNYSICAKTNLVNEQNTINDKLCMSIVGTGLGDNIDNSVFAMSQNQPNPTRDETSVEYFIPNTGKVQFILTNLLGEQIYSSQIQQSYGKHLWKINTSNIDAGVYYYSIIYDNQVYTRKMVILK